MKKRIEKSILHALIQKGKKGAHPEELQKLSGVSPSQKPLYERELQSLLSRHQVISIRNRFFLPDRIGAVPALVVKRDAKYCFVTIEKTGERVFIPGRYSQNALTGDRVLVRPFSSNRGENKEGRILTILSYQPSPFSGVLLKQGTIWNVLPDHLCNIPIRVSRFCAQAQEGEKVMAKIGKRSKHLEDLQCEVLASYGNAQKASACCQAILASRRVSQSFPPACQKEASYLQKKGVQIEGKRKDFRPLPIFTIDSADSKDLDDAISIKKLPKGGYLLGVHIADVSHYVKEGSPLDQEALARGCSVYYADQVIPMLPSALSNGICSLYPGEDRLCLSALLTLDSDANLIHFSFTPSVIRSRVKGVYQEVNQILAKKADTDLLEKYADILPSLPLFEEVYEKRKLAKKKRGVPQLETTESKILLDQQGAVYKLSPRESGRSEEIIEECMLLANEAAARLAKENHLPFLYRVHEAPSAEKVENLKKILARFGIDSSAVHPGLKPGVLSDLLEKTRSSSLFPVINMQVLRSMSKARYDEKPLGHYALNLKDYAHFTSPIRRYPDLMIHRILSEAIQKKTPAELKRRYHKKVKIAAVQSSAAERKAIEIERACEDCYKAEYMASYLGQSFEGIITSVLPRGFFVLLPNTAEGFVRMETENSQLQYDGFCSLKNMLTGERYTVGQPIRVICEQVSVNRGKIDFSLDKTH